LHRNGSDGRFEGHLFWSIAMKRFWDKVNRTSDPSDCWEWNAGKFPNGYGQFRLRGKTKYSHRLSYEFCFGTIPPNICVCHKCDNPLCVRPSHLFLGTHKDNAIDKCKKGRNPIRSKITKEQAQDIYHLAIERVMSQEKIALLFNVSQQTVSAIKTKNAWDKITTNSCD
jgi:hypothetical protein